MPLDPKSDAGLDSGKTCTDRSCYGSFLFPQVCGKDIEESIKSETSGGLEKAYLTLGKKQLFQDLSFLVLAIA